MAPLELAKRHSKPILLGVAIAILYRNILRELALDWWNNPDYSHGLILPFVTVYLIWTQRKQMASEAAAPSNFGLLVMLGGLSVLFAGELGAEFFLARVSLLILLAGLILFFFGWSRLWRTAFPLGLFLLAIPLPAIIFYQITFPLQLLASQVGSFLLDSLRVPVLREGNLIILPHTTLEVVEACSGIRSLFSLVTLTLLYGYFLEPRLSLRLILLALSVPLALVCNGMRIMGTGVLTQYMGAEAAEGFFHTFSGWFLFSMALGSLIVIHKGLSLLWGNLKPMQEKAANEIHVSS